MADGKVTIEVLLDDKGATKGTKKVEGTLKGIGGAAKRGVATVGKLAGALGLVGLAYKGIDMVKQSLDGAIDRYDTLNNYPKVMELIGFDAQTSRKAIDRLSDGIQGLPTRLDEVAGTAQNIAVMTGDLDKAVETTLALNNAFLFSGSSSADAARGLEQYVQMLSKGEVDLQSWRTLQETMGVALNTLANDFGFTGASAQNDLYDASKEGEITFDEFNTKLIEASTAQGGFADKAQVASGGIKTAMTKMKTWVVMGVTDILKSLDEAMGGVGSIEGAINKLKPIFSNIFGFIADVAIPKFADSVVFVRDKFNEFRDRMKEFRPVIENVIEKMAPLIQVFEKTGNEIMNQFSPIWENLKTLFRSLMPILEVLGALIGGTLLTAIVIWTSALNGVQRAIGPVINALISLVDFIVNIVNMVIALLTGDFTGALDYWNAATESAVNFFMSLWDAVVGFVMGIVETVIGWFEFLYEMLVGNSIVPDMVNAIVDWFKNMYKWLIELVKSIVQGIVQNFQDMHDKISSVMQMINTIISSILTYVKNTFQNALMFLKGLMTGDIVMMRQAVQNKMQNMHNLISNIVNALPNTFKNGLVKVRSALSSGLNSALRVVTGD